MCIGLLIYYEKDVGDTCHISGSVLSSYLDGFFMYIVLAKYTKPLISCQIAFVKLLNFCRLTIFDPTRFIYARGLSCLFSWRR